MRDDKDDDTEGANTVTLTQAEALLRHIELSSRSAQHSKTQAAASAIRAQLAPKRAEPTPGPWKVVVGNRTICVSHSTRTILYCEQWCEGWDREFLDSEDMANARLIAAAPQFLEWAEQYLKSFSRGDYGWHTLCAIVDSVYGGDDD